MKVEELMIGDWIFDGGNIAQITGITCDGIIETTVDEASSIEDIEPIPLTPKILEKNGFVKKKKWAQIGNFGDSPLIMWHFEDNATLHDFKHELEIHQNDTGKVHITIPCEYVHELQHALRLCNIEKEIVSFTEVKKMINYGK